MKSYITYITALLCLSAMFSCTYDYFEDETNYIVYVPKADKGKNPEENYEIEDLQLFIFQDGLEKERYSITPFDEDPRAVLGSYNFKLFPGIHDVLCFSNTSGIQFSETHSYNTAKLNLTKSADGYYNEPSNVLSEIKNPNLGFPSRPIVDTTFFDYKYVGRICVAFKNMESIDPKIKFENIKKVEIVASGIGTYQYFNQISDSVNTRSGRYSDQDKMKLTSSIYKNPYQGYAFGFQNLYLPSPIGDAKQGIMEPISLTASLIDQNDNIIHTTIIDIADKTSDQNLVPIVLHSNQTLIVGVDGNKVQILHFDKPQDWDDNIQGGGNSSPNGGGLEVM